MLCKEIAKELLYEYEWVWKPVIETPENEEKNFIIPEITVLDGEEIVEIIDAKRSVNSVTYKDLKIYPLYANRIIFWCLYGDSQETVYYDEVEDIVIPLIFLSSADIISMLENRMNKHNENTIHNLIKQIRLLKKGVSFVNQTLLTDFF